MWGLIMTTLIAWSNITAAALVETIKTVTTLIFVRNFSWKSDICTMHAIFRGSDNALVYFLRELIDRYVQGVGMRCAERSQIGLKCGCFSSKTPWRNGSASDSRSEGCVFKSRRGQKEKFYFSLLNSSIYETSIDASHKQVKICSVGRVYMLVNWNEWAKMSVLCSFFIS